MVTSAFHVRLVEGDPYEIKMAGAIDEKADFSLAFAPPNKQVIIDMTHVSAIKPVGIREFRNWVHGLSNPVLIFTNLPRTFINLLNMSPQLLPPNSRVDSFYVPYYSESGGEEMDVLFRRNVDFSFKDNKLVFDLPDVRDSMGNEMLIDAVQERYFQFLKSVVANPKPTNP